MGFREELERIGGDRLRARIAAATTRDVERALAKDRPDEEDVPALVSRAADPFLEELARRSAATTRRRFGRAMTLYAPLYVANSCVNRCVYCGFAADHDRLERRTLDAEEIRAEAAIIASRRIQHLLLVAGEDPRVVTPGSLAATARDLAGLFASISVEVQPFDRAGYETLCDAGVCGLAIYQETYDPVLYARFHPAGPKRNYARRLESMEHGGEAGMRSLGIGALLGLDDWRFETACLLLHGRYLERRFWRSQTAISFPRIRDAEGHFRPPCPASDRDLVQMICVARIVCPDAEIVLSTREPAALRDNLLPLGITRISAGSRTNPGGYGGDDAGEQFAVSDPRSVEEIAATLAARGFDPVFKDFDRTLAVPV
ncbi:MAG TPA: 2-iminoacetate synthase ThiH [Acidobacteriota bacterium]|nr:2-iminoacetate synthase ThiH [Acidobacteriota bacterium]